MEVDDISSDWSSVLSSPFRRISSLVLNRIRRFDNLTTQWDNLVESGYAKTSADANTRLQRRLRETIGMPGPLGFASSGYFLGVIFMVCTSLLFGTQTW